MSARKLVALGGIAAGLLIAPASAAAAEQTFVGEVPTGTIAPYEVKQDIAAPIPRPPGAGYITKMETDIVDADTGEPVPISRLMLHHIVFANIGMPDSTCSSFTGFDGLTVGLPFGLQRFFAAGEERAKISMPPGYGYQINGGSPWAMTYMVMNHRSSPDNAVIQYKVTYETDPLTPVTPWWLDVRDCRADPIYNVQGTKKKGGDHTVTRDYTIPEAGRIIAGAGHVHGGAHRLALTQPDCGNRQVAESLPTWGNPDHPFYNVRPILHEPGPINMSAFGSQTGIPVGAGQRVRLNSLYEGSRPHVRVMGIMILYIAADPAAAPCGPLPGDTEILKTDQPGRTGGPIPFTIPLTGLNAQGEAVTIRKPPGKLKKVESGTRTHVQNRLFGRPNLKIERGDVLNWQFDGSELHNLTLANGPVGIGTENLNGSRGFSRKFGRPGTYRFFCGLHPVQMSQRVVVKDTKKKKKKRKKRD